MSGVEAGGGGGVTLEEVTVYFMTLSDLLCQIVENGFIGLGKLASILGDHCALLG